MFCSNCGAKNADDALFCQECGAKLYTPISTEENLNIIEESVSSENENNNESTEGNVAEKTEQSDKETTKSETNNVNTIQKPTKIVKPEKQTTPKAPREKKPLTPQAKIGLFAGAIVIIAIGAGAAWSMTQPNKVDWTENQTCSVTGFDGFGTVTCEFIDGNQNIFAPSYTSNQWDAIEKWDQYVVNTVFKFDKYGNELTSTISSDYISSAESALVSVQGLKRNGSFVEIDSKIMNGKKSEKEASKLVKEVEDIISKSDMNGLFSCEFIFPEGKENGKLSNGDTIQYVCKTNSLAEGKIKTIGESSIDIVATGLEETTIVDIDSLLEESFAIKYDGHDLLLKPNVEINFDNLPAGVNDGDISVSAFEYNDYVDVSATSYKEGVFLISSSQQDECNGKSRCNFNYEYQSMPTFEAVPHFKYDDGTRPENYDQLATLVYEKVNPLFDKIGWGLTDENTGTYYTISNYELVNYDLESGYDFWKHNAFYLLVHTNEGIDFKLDIDGYLYSLNGTYICEFEDEVELTGIVDANGNIK